MFNRSGRVMRSLDLSGMRLTMLGILYRERLVLIITNSSLQLLMKQSTADIDSLQKVFNLTEQEKYLLIEAAVGEGLFFAGRKHVYLSVVASQTETRIVTTNPQEVLQRRKEDKDL